MPLHRLTSITVGVPDVTATEDYYTDFGLASTGRGLATVDGGEQLKLVQTPYRQLVELGIGVDNPDDLDRITASLARIEVPSERHGNELVTQEPVAGFRVSVSVAPHYVQAAAERPVYNGPGRIDRANDRAPGILRQGPVRPRRLGHVVLGSVEHLVTTKFFVDGLGFKVSDEVKDHASFLRCSSDHHNVFVQKAPVNYLHHTAWQVDDLDEVGRGAMAMLEDHPERHAWGMGRHFLGSNFFWYLRDPSGHFSEYYSDLDCIVDDELWTPGVYEGAKAMFAYGPPPTPSFLEPEDLASLMMGHHSVRK